MEFEVKFYRMHDLDIVGLRDLGYPVQAMLKKALIGYANGSPVHYVVDEPNANTLTGAKAFRVKIKLKDEATIAMLKNIRSRQRNSFCKALFRNSLMHQSLAMYYVNNSCSKLENVCINECLDGSMANIYRVDKDAMKKRNLALKELAVRSVVDPNQETLKKINDMYASMETLLKNSNILQSDDGQKNAGEINNKPKLQNRPAPEKKEPTHEPSDLPSDNLPISSNTLPSSSNNVYSDIVEGTYDRNDNNIDKITDEAIAATSKDVDVAENSHDDVELNLESGGNAASDFIPVSSGEAATSTDLSNNIPEEAPSSTDNGVPDDFEGDDLMDMFDKLIND